MKCFRFFLNFSYVCPKPVLAKRSVLHKLFKKGSHSIPDTWSLWLCVRGEQGLAPAQERSVTIYHR